MFTLHFSELAFITNFAGTFSSVLMTMFILDAKAAFLSKRELARTGEINELMYVDDTLIPAVNNANAKICVQCIEQAGRMYGLRPNWNKVEVLPVRC